MDRVYAVAVFAESKSTSDIVTLLRKACGWDGSGEPPDVVIRPDGTLAHATEVEVQTPNGNVNGLYKIDYVKKKDK